MFPADPILAVRHPNPYPYYDALRREQPFAYSKELGCWIAASAEAAASVMKSDACGVRPASEPVPSAIRGRATGALFGAWIRMRDDPARGEVRQLVAAGLAQLSDAHVAAVAADQVRELTAARAGLDTAVRAVPVRSVAALLGVPRGQLAEVCDGTHDLVRSLAEGADAALLDAGDRAARMLTERVSAAVRRAIPAPSEALVTNAVGLLVQSCEATAAWIGNALVAWARAGNHVADVDGLVDRVLHEDPPVQNTRRFVARDTSLAGQTLHAGERILVVLAAALRDPGAAEFAFGHAGHACPGARPSRAIVCAALAELSASGVTPSDVLERLAYRGLPNIRLPHFDPNRGEVSP